MTAASSDFTDRLERIRQRAPNTNGTILVGLDGRYAPPDRKLPRRSKSSDLVQNAAYPLSILAAFLLGACASAVGRFARFALEKGPLIKPDPDMDMILNGVIGILISLILSQFIRMRTREHAAIQSLGVLAMLLGFHNLVHWQPEIFVRLFSQLWVTDILTTTKPSSILFRGITFDF